MVKNLKDLFAKFNNEDKCREFLVQQRWNGKPICPYCNHDKVYSIETGKRFKCANQTCYKKFSVITGTVFHGSNIPLTTWFPAMYIIASHKKGISSVQLAKDLGVTQKTAWFMLHRMRESLKENHAELLGGIVEIDETYMGRKFASEYKALGSEDEYRVQATSTRMQGAVIGVVQRGGNVRTEVWDARTVDAIKTVAERHIAKDNAIVMTDESNLYNKVLAGYNRQSVNHGKGEWVRGIAHNNNMENFWSVMRRGIYGIYHQVSYKHLQAYCNEFSFRYNSRKIADGERFELTLTQLQGRLTYKQLVHGKSKKAS